MLISSNGADQLAKPGDPHNGGSQAAAHGNQRLGYAARNGSGWASQAQDYRTNVNAGDRYNNLIAVRCPPFNTATCAVKLVVWGLGVTANENSGTTYLGIERSDTWRHIAWEGNGFGSAHDTVRFEIYNYAGHEVEIDAAYMWKDN